MNTELFNDHNWRITLDTVTLPNGVEKTQAIAHRIGSVHIIAQSVPGKILLIREFRAFMNEWRWMLPAGKMDKEHEDPKEAAQRELREETGYRADFFEPFCVCRPSENIDQRNHIFVASGLVKDPLPMENYEMIEVHEMTVDEAIEKVLSQSPLLTINALALLKFARDHA